MPPPMPTTFPLIWTSESDRQSTGLSIAKAPLRAWVRDCDKRVTRLAVLLLHGYALPVDDAVELLTAWGQSEKQQHADGSHYPWTEKEMVRKVRWAAGQRYDGRYGDRLRHNGHELNAAVEAIIGSGCTSDIGSRSTSEGDSRPTECNQQAGADATQKP